MISAVLLSGLGAPALADPPQPGSTAAPSTAAPPPAAPATDVPPTDAAPTTANRVLIVHTSDGGASLHTTIGRADTPQVALRHTFTGTDSFSVEVSGSDEAATVDRLEALPDVTSVEPAVSRHLFGTPDDPGYPRQKSYLSAVSAPQAWQRQHGSANVKIAVLDTGIDVGHPDLASKIVGTYNADTGSSTITDQVGHGTFVAGVAAAAPNNGVGVTGAGYDTSLLGVKIAAHDGSLPIDDEIAGIHWAVAHGADIINLSLGGPDYSSSERAAIEYAIGKGVVVVAAAGNDGTSTKQYPAAYPGVLAVAATDPAAKQRAAFSTYGSWVSVAAPGVDIYSTAPRAGSQFFAGRTGYATGDGTSFSAPLVAGEAALLEAQAPTMSGAAIRRALVASTRGFERAGVGRGQVDFDLALDHVAPSTKPSAVNENGTAGTIRLTATSSAPKVSFGIDQDAFGTPVSVQGGQAVLDVASWGLANGTHTVRAVDCSAFGTCSATASTAGFDLSNAAPGITSPASGSSPTGRFEVTATNAGGGARLFVDGTPAGFSAASPYTFTVNGSALTDNTHVLTVTSCNVSGSRCDGPTSAPCSVRTTSLHPSLRSIRPAAISPNHDGVLDAATLAFDLPDTEDVTGQVIDSTGRTVRSVALGTLAGGSHLWRWQGAQDDGKVAADGRYTLAVSTSTSSSSTGVVRGFTGGPVVIDTHAPTLSGLTGGGTRFWPVHDGYHDLFAPRVTLSGSGHLDLMVTDTRGRVLRRLGGWRQAGVASLVWNGRDSRNRLVRDGTYDWTYAVTDAAGNTRRTGGRHVYVSDKRLVTQLVEVRLNGSATNHAVGTDRSCSSARTKPSHFRHGILLTNSCRPSHGDLAFASYRFTVPSAITYRSIALSAYGHSDHRPSELSAALPRTDGGLEIPGHTRVSRKGDRWVTITKVPARGHITGARHVEVSVLLDSSFAAHNDFDMKWARLRISLVRLK